MSEYAIELSGLTKFYGKHRGVSDLTFQVARGDIFGFIGPNGAGKSTTIRCLLALIFPTGGSARIFGRDCIQCAPELAASIGYLPAEPAYYEQMTVREQLDYAAELYGKAGKNRIQELCDRMSLDPKRKIRELSLGNRKKVGIVAALLHSPELLILDEPTGGLDPLVQHTFHEILREENKKGVTVFFSSHVLSEVQKICSRVAIIKEGELIGIQNIREFSEVGYKKIELVAKNDIPGGYFDVDGVADFRQSGNNVSFLFRGDLNEMLERICRLRVKDVLVGEPPLEDVFMHYYR